MTALTTAVVTVYPMAEMMVSIKDKRTVPRMVYEKVASLVGLKATPSVSKKVVLTVNEEVVLMVDH